MHQATAPRRTKRQKWTPQAAKNPLARVRRARASRSSTPPLRNDQITIQAATAPAIVVASPVLSSSALRLSSTAPKPMIDGTNVVASPLACAENSCHQS